MSYFNLRNIKSKLLTICLGAGIILQIGIIAYFFYPTNSTISDQMNQENMTVTASNIEESSYSLIKNPQYFGLDNNNEPFTITAIDATQTNKNTVLLNQMAGTAKLNPNTPISFFSDNSEMELENYIVNAHNARIEINGVILTAEEATINTKTKYLKGEKNVKAKGNATEILADYCLITDNYKEIIFKSNNKVTTYITP